jgi:hypothetical protein
MTSKHPIVCVAISAAVVLKLFAGTADVAVLNGGELNASKGRVLLTVLHDASGRLDGAKFYAGRYIVNQASGSTGRPIIVTDISNPTPRVQLGRGVDIARVDGEIVNS